MRKMTRRSKSPDSKMLILAGIAILVPAVVVAVGFIVIQMQSTALPGWYIGEEFDPDKAKTNNESVYLHFEEDGIVNRVDSLEYVGKDKSLKGTYFETEDGRISISIGGKNYVGKKTKDYLSIEYSEGMYAFFHKFDPEKIEERDK